MPPPSPYRWHESIGQLTEPTQARLSLFDLHPITFQLEALWKAYQFVRNCRSLLQGMLENQRTNMKYEEADYDVFEGSDNTQGRDRIQYAETGRKIIQQNLSLSEEEKRLYNPEITFTYPSRGEAAEIEKAKGNAVYDLVKQTFTADDLGKLVDLDVDKKAIIAIGSDIEELKLKAKAAGPINRIYIRKIGDDLKTGLTIY